MKKRRRIEEVGENQIFFNIRIYKIIRICFFKIYIFLFQINYFSVLMY